jgi:D-alanyl-D-alanine carboxypeptidase
VQETAPQPETLALAALPPADDALGLIDPAAQTPVTAETDVDALAAAVAVAAAEADAAAPAEAVPTEAAAAEAAPPEAALAEAPAIDDGAATDLAVLAAVAELAGAEDEPPPPVQVAGAETMRPAQRPEAVLLAAAAAAPAADPAPAQTEVAVASLLPGVASLFGTGSSEPAAPAVAEDPADALASQIVLAEAAPPAETARPLEEIFAVSTSGGRQWGITLGSYGSRYEAERQLLQTALVEMTTLEDGLRKVVGRGGGYDANFVGLTEEQADLACRRLAARSEPCEVIGPGA